MAPILCLWPIGLYPGCQCAGFNAISQNMPAKEPVKFVFFDAAFTLIEPKQSVGQTYAGLADRFGVDLDIAEMNSRFGEAFRNAPPLCFPNASPASLKALEYSWWRSLVVQVVDPRQFPTPIIFENYFEEVFDFYATKMAWRLCAHTLVLLQALQKQKIPMAIVSNFDSRLHAILQQLDIHEFFRKIFISSEVGFAKPDPRIFLHAIENMGVSNPSHVAYLGDDDRLDISPSASLGMQAYCCLTPSFDVPTFLTHIGLVPIR